MAERKKPLWEKLLTHYQLSIENGELAEGDRLPSEMEMASAHGVSRITATRALKELESTGLIRRIKGSGSFVSKKNLPLAEPGAAGSANGLKIISLVVPFADGFSEEFVHGIEKSARGAGYFVTVHNSAEDADTERSIMEDLMKRGSSGIILYPIGLSENMDLYSRLVIGDFPLVLIDRRIPGLDLPVVSVDNRQGFQDIVGHLLDLGHRRVVIAGESVDEASSETDRYDGYCQAHLERGVPVPKHHVYTVDFDYEEDHLSASNRLFRDFRAMPMESRPTAVAAMNDEAARFIMSAAIEQGLSIPGDLAVTGFDDLPFAAHLPVPLTTVAQPAFEIGAAAAELLLHCIKRPGVEVPGVSIPSKLVVRESSGVADA